MCSTAELAQIADVVAAGGGKLVYTGDQGQLTSVGAGGMLALLVADNGAHQLEQVHRFDSDWEREASLRLRAGDTSVIPEYEDRGRLQAGTVEQMQAAAVRGYLADTLDGKDSLLIVGSNEEAARLSRDIRDQLIDYGQVSAEPLTELGRRAGGVEVSVGDRVQARRWTGPSGSTAGSTWRTGRSTQCWGSTRTGRCGCAAPTAGSRTCRAATSTST